MLKYGPVLFPINERPTTAIAVLSAPKAAAQALREAIITGELKGGDRILEQKWAARLGIGQPTLREGLKELEHQGLLIKYPQRGTYVTQLSPTDYRGILEVRIPLEAIAISRAAVRLTPEAERELSGYVAEMAGSGREMELARFHDSDVAFHRRIWTLANNDFLKATLETITFRLFIFSVVGRWPQAPNAQAERLAAVQQHLSILEGLRTRNAARARAAFIHHTVNYWNAQYGLDLTEAECETSEVRQA
jgi:DNA-binding GntR family transcriptional regulator